MRGSNLRTTLLCLYCTLLPSFTAAQPSPAQEEDADASLDSATMAILVLVVVSALLFLGSFSLWIQTCCADSTRPDFRSVISVGSGSRFTHELESPAESTAGVDKEIIDSFPTMAYSTAKEMKIGVGSLECAVCMSEFSGLELLRLLPSCDHVFHLDCIARWLADHANCPVCRARVMESRTIPKEMEEGSAGDRHPTAVSQYRGHCDRFTLMLADRVKAEIIMKTGLKLKKRSASCENLGGESSGGQIGRCLGRSERWSVSVAPGECLAANGEGRGNILGILPV